MANAKKCVEGLAPEVAERLLSRHKTEKETIKRAKDMGEDEEFIKALKEDMRDNKLKAEEEFDEWDEGFSNPAEDIKFMVDLTSGVDELPEAIYKTAKHNDDANKYIKSMFSYNKRFGTVSVENIQRQVFGMFEKYSPTLMKIIDTPVLKQMGEARRVTKEWFSGEGDALKKEVVAVIKDKAARQIKGVYHADKVINRMVDNIENLQAPNRDKIRLTDKDTFINEMSDWVEESNDVIGYIYDVQAGDKTLLDKEIRNQILGVGFEDMSFNFKFKNQESWQAFHNKYGRFNNALDMLVSKMDSSAKELGLIRVFNSVNPKATYDELMGKMTAAGMKPDSTLNWTAAEAFDETLGWDPAIGKGRMALYQAASAIPKLSNLAILSKAFMTAMGTDMVAWATMKGIKYGDFAPVGDMVNYLSSVGSNIAEAFGKDTRVKQAMRHANIQRQGMLQRFMHNVRLGEDNFDMGGAARKLENAAWRANLMTKATQIGHDYAVMDTMQKLATYRNTTWDELPDWLQERLSHSEIGEDSWETIISNDDHFIKIDGLDVINFDGFSDTNLDLYNFLDNFIRNDADMSLGAEAMSITAVKNMGKKKGGARVASQFAWNLKSYVLRQTYQTVGSIFEETTFVSNGKRAAVAIPLIAAGYGMGLGTDYAKSVLSGDVKIGDKKSEKDWWEDSYTHIAAFTYGAGFGLMNDGITTVGNSLFRDKDLGSEAGKAVANILVSPAFQSAGDVVDAAAEGLTTGYELVDRGRVSNKQMKQFASDMGEVRDDVMPKLWVVEQMILQGIYDNRYSSRELKKKLDKKQHKSFGKFMERGLLPK